MAWRLGKESAYEWIFMRLTESKIFSVIGMLLAHWPQ